MTTKVDAYFDMVKNLNVSFEWFTYDNETYKNADGSHFDVGGWSVFGTYKIKPDKLMALRPLRRLPAQPDQSRTTTGPWSSSASTGSPGDATGRLQPNIWIYDYKRFGQEDRHRLQHDLLPQLLRTNPIHKEK